MQVLNTAFAEDRTEQCHKSFRDELEQARALLAEHEVHYILALFTDVHGSLKSKSVPVSALENLATEGAGFAGAAISGFGMEPHDPEYMMVADLSTLKLLSWLPGYACVMGTGMTGGEVCRTDPRNILKHQTSQLAARGMQLMVGMEPEFYLLSEDAQGRLQPFGNEPDGQQPTYSFQGLTRNRAILEQIHEALSCAGMEVYQIDHEDAPGQFELNFNYSDALDTADCIQFFKMAAREIAYQQGALCSFLPKLSNTTTGNGMHMHCSLTDSSGKNLFHDPADPQGMGLSAMAHHFIAGIISHAPALTALLCPTVNSYKRLISGTPEAPSWAPVFIAWGDNNRSAMIRIPYGRIEIRIGDGSMNTYLATAAVIAAGMDGVERRLTPPQATSANLFRDMDAAAGTPVLPATLNEALQQLEQNKVLKDALGHGVTERFIALKRAEWQEYNRTVSDWEIRRYLNY